MMQQIEFSGNVFYLLSIAHVNHEGELPASNQATISLLLKTGTYTSQKSLARYEVINDKSIATNYQQC